MTNDSKLIADIRVATSNIVKSPTIKRSITSIVDALIDSLNEYERDFPPNNQGPPYEGLRTDYWELAGRNIRNFKANQYKTQFTLELINNQPPHHYSVRYVREVKKPSPYGEIYVPMNRMYNTKGLNQRFTKVGVQFKTMNGDIVNLAKVRQDIKGGIVKPRKPKGTIVFWNGKGQIVFCKSRKNSWRGHEQYKTDIEERIKRFFETHISGEANVHSQNIIRSSQEYLR